MALFGNEAKKQAKRLSPGDWMLWSCEIRIASNEAAVVVAQTQTAGEDMAAIGMRLFQSAWQGAANEALEYYPQAAVQAAYDDRSLRRHAIALLSKNQVNATLDPPFPPDQIRHLQDSLPEPGPDGVARDAAFWSGTEPLEAGSLEDVTRIVASAHTRPELSLEERDAIADSALAWVDLHEPDRALRVREILIQTEIARHLKELNAEREGVNDELVANKLLMLILEMVKGTADPNATGDTMAAYLDRGIPSIVNLAVEAMVERDAVGLGTARRKV